MIKVLITGPESSGKSYLSEKLARHYGGLIVEEYARLYLNNKDGYEISDLLEIAIGQLDLEERMERTNPNMLICDTGIEVIKIWSTVKYDYVNPLIIEMCDYSQYDLILLCEPNIPWVSDVLRENPLDREYIFGLYKSELLAQSAKLHVIDAELSDRLSQAVNIIDEYAY